MDDENGGTNTECFLQYASLCSSSVGLVTVAYGIQRMFSHCRDKRNKTFYSYIMYTKFFTSWMSQGQYVLYSTKPDLVK